METQNTDGGGGVITPTGTAASMCAISPSDLVGTIGNLISRIESLEKIVSNVLGANLHAQTLGDLSDQVGWVYGVEYMGIPGWIQTEYGTLIPPPGFTMSSSGIQMWNACTGTFQNFQAVVMDENGILQWGADSIGGLCGTKVEAWDAAAATVGATPYFASLRAGYTASNGVTVNTNNLSSTMGIGEVVVSEAGYYLITATARASYGNILGSPSWGYILAVSKNGLSLLGDSAAAGPHAEAETDTIHLTVSTIQQLAAGDVLKYETQSPTVGVENTTSKSFYVLKVSNIP